MSMQDPIADAITRIRNAQRASHSFTEICSSKLNINIVELLEQEGYIDGYKIIEETDGKSGPNKYRKVIKIALKYYRGLPVISKITRVSKPSRRVYLRAKDIKLVRNGLGIAIVSTPKGLLTDKAAREQNLGGELLLTVE
jgi:small subunit ribosomal protein S8